MASSKVPFVLVWLKITYLEDFMAVGTIEGSSSKSSLYLDKLSFICWMRTLCF